MLQTTAVHHNKMTTKILQDPSTMAIMNNHKTQAIRVHGMLWPRYLLREEETPHTSICQGLTSKKGKRSASSIKLLPHKAGQTSSKRKTTRHVVQEVQEQLKDIENTILSNSSHALASTFTTLDDHHRDACGSPLSPSHLNTMGVLAQKPSSTMTDSLPMLLPEHSYCWNRTTLTGRPALVTGQKWSRVVPVKPSKSMRQQRLHKISHKQRLTSPGSRGSLKD